MVMEEEPAPEYVGREFVRQYYTVLHMCPENLHRFYSTESSFVHGGIEPSGESSRVAKGQTEIHKRITSLNLRECRAKIRQVDSFETVNGALVIQVIGELANAGESLRRFVQTFVLVQQSPKSYYVYNDIFRYQDDVFQVEDDEPVVSSKPVAQKPRAEEAMDFVQPAQDNHVTAPETETFTRNGNWSEAEEKKQPAQQPAAPFSQQQNASPVKDEGRVFNRSAPEQSPQVSPKKEVAAANIVIAEPDENRAPAQSAPSSNKPLTFAAVAGGGRSSPPTAPVTHNENKKSTPVQQKQASKPAANQRDKSPEHSTHGSVSNGDAGDVEMTDARQGNHGGRNARQASNYPNEQQVFVGNLPQDVTDEELQEFMTKFGGVAEVKIVNKAGRQQGNKVTPAFAFVTFENVESVDKMISQLPINDFRGTLRLNIERKQERERSGNYYGNQGGNYRGGHGATGGRGGMRGGMQGRRFAAGGPRNDNRQ